MARPLGSQNKDKPFAEALRMELAAAGEDRKALRRIARKLIANAESGDMQAIGMIADRLDGKPAQEVNATIDDKRDASDWTRDELVAVIRDASNGGDRATSADGRGKRSDRVH